MNPKHHTDQLPNDVAAFAVEHALWGPGDRLLVGVSGGADSLSLLHMLGRIAPAHNMSVHVAHVDHRLRPDSDADAAFVAATAREWDVPCTVVARDARPLTATYGGVEAAARAIRYGILRDLALELGCNAVLVAHTADDQAETMLMRLLRGTGTSGLAGMRPRLAYRQWRGIGIGKCVDTPAIEPALVRPMLRVERTAIETYCAVHGLLPRRDPSNESPEHLRNRVRGHIIPTLKAYNARIVAMLGRTARICAEEDAFLQEQVDIHWQRVATGGNTVTLERTPFIALHVALRRRLLRRAVAEVAPGVMLESDHLDRMLRRAVAERGRLQLPGGVWMRVAKGTITVERVPER